jgi:single-strand DNA-binding protein
MIKLQIIGNLGKDCIVKEVNGKTVINFSVAHTEKYKDSQGNPKDKTTWVECAYWTDRTAVAQYLTKGRTVYAEGSPEEDAYTNKEGQAAATLRMRVQNVQLLSGNNADSGSSSQSNAGYVASSSPQPSRPAPVSMPADDDLPF